MTIVLGNLMPEEEALINIQMISEIEIDAGSCFFQLPVATFPNYQKHPRVD